MFDSKSGGELCALWKWVTPSWLGGHIPLAINSLVGARVKVVGLQWRSWPAACKSSGNWVTGISQLIMNTFPIPFDFLMQGLIMNSAHYTSRVGELQQGMALKGRSIYSLPLDRKSVQTSGLDRPSHPSGIDKLILRVFEIIVPKGSV